MNDHNSLSNKYKSATLLKFVHFRFIPRRYCTPNIILSSQGYLYLQANIIRFPYSRPILVDSLRVSTYPRSCFKPMNACFTGISCPLFLAFWPSSWFIARFYSYQLSERLLSTVSDGAVLRLLAQGSFCSSNRAAFPDVFSSSPPA